MSKAKQLWERNTFMRRSNKLGLAVTAVLSLSAGTVFMPAAARGNIWVANNGNGGTTVSEYTNAGSPVNGNGTLISGLNEPCGIALSGADLYVVNSGNNTIGEYYAGNGTVINAALVSGLNAPRDIAVLGSNLYVANSGNGTIGEYNAGNGTVINAGLVTGLNLPMGIAVSGSNLYVANLGSSTIGEYNAGNGTVINAGLVTGVNQPIGLAVSGSNLYVVNSGNNTIGEYNAGNGTAVNASLVSGLNYPRDIAVLGSNLYATNFIGTTIGEYNAGNGTAVNASLVSGLGRPWGIAVTASANSALLTITATGTATPAYTGAGNASSITVTNTGVGYYVPGLLNHITANGGNGSVKITGFANNDPEIIAVALSVTDGNGTHAPTAQELTDIITDLNAGQSLATGVTSATVEAFSGNTTGTLQHDNASAYNLLNTSETTAGGGTLDLAVLVTGTTLTSPQTFGIDFSSETADGMSAVDVTDIAVVPEPATLSLLAVGSFGLLARRRRRAA